MVTTFKFYRDFSRPARQLSPHCVVGISKEYLRPQRFYGCPSYLQNELDQIKIEGAKVAITMYMKFSGAKGQLTPKSNVGM